MSNKKSILDKLIELVKDERKEIINIYFYAMFSGLIQLSLPIGIQAIIGFVMGATMVTSIYVLIFFIVLGVFLVGVLQINQMRIIERIQQKIFVRNGIDIAEKIPSFDLIAIDSYYLPEKINRFFDIQNIQKGFSKLLLEIPVASIQILFGMILLSLYHPLFIIFSLVLILLLILIFRLTTKKGLQTSIEESENKYKFVAWLQEMGRVIKSLKFSQGTHLNLTKSDYHLTKYVQSRTSHFNVLLMQFKSLVLFKVSITALMLLLGTYLLFEQKINVGQFVAAEIVILLIINALEKLIVSLEYIYDIITGLEKVHTLKNFPLEEDGSIEFKKSDVAIEFDKVCFGYSDNNYVLHNFSSTISPNSITCITGEENSGKSTLLKLLTCNYRKFSGMILLNDLPLLNYDLQSLRSNTGVMLNEQDIFEGTLLDNITLGKNIGIDDIVKLAKSLNIHSMLLSFPKSFETKISPIGNRLPSSIIKKILLLRAFIHQPRLLILEEPWLGLDDETKISIQNYLLDISKSRTIIIATNDKEFSTKCNKVINLTKLNIA
jgi:ABC-type bacteriocin/lantibiotic exporter with double-glycine peptidase domain